MNTKDLGQGRPWLQGGLGAEREGEGAGDSKILLVSRTFTRRPSDLCGNRHRVGDE